MKSSTSTFGVTTPVLAVTTPTESTFVTSSYVNVPAIETLPLTLREERVPTDVIFGCAAVCSVPVGLPVKFPTNVVAVTIPAFPS